MMFGECRLAEPYAQIGLVFDKNKGPCWECSGHRTGVLGTEVPVHRLTMNGSRYLASTSTIQMETD